MKETFAEKKEKWVIGEVWQASTHLSNRKASETDELSNELFKAAEESH